MKCYVNYFDLVSARASLKLLARNGNDFLQPGAVVSLRAPDNTWCQVGLFCFAGLLYGSMICSMMFWFKAELCNPQQKTHLREVAHV